MRISANILKEIGTTKPRIPFHISAGFGLQNQGDKTAVRIHNQKILQTILEKPLALARFITTTFEGKFIFISKLESWQFSG